MTLVCKMDKNTGKIFNTLYYNSENFHSLSNADANKFFQQSAVKEYSVVNTEAVYIETIKF